MCCTVKGLHILLLGPNRWPRDTEDPGAGLAIRRRIIRENRDLDVKWSLLEDDRSSRDITTKFLSFLNDPVTSHVFLLWPRDAKMVGTQDELIMWQVFSHLGAKAPELYLFHQDGVLSVEQRKADRRIIMQDPQGKSPYLYDLLARGVYQRQWEDLRDLENQVRDVLEAHLGAIKRK